MKYFYSLLTILFLLNTPVLAQTVNVNAVDSCIYLKLDDTCTINLEVSFTGNSYINTAFIANGVTEVKNPFKGINAQLDQTYRVSFDNATNIDTFIASLELIDIVEYAEYVPLFTTSVTPNDIAFQQYYIDLIQAEDAWDISTGSDGVRIAIVDNAVSTVHADLIPNLYVNPGEIPGNGLDDDLNGFTDDVSGYDVADSDGDPNPPASSTSSDPWVHGTHCAGIAGASTDNSFGVASIGFNCEIIPVKCTNNSSTGNTLPNAYEGVSYAMQANADVISMSFGGNSIISITGENVINAAYNAGIVLVAAAGNDNSDDVFFPAGFQNVISVGSTNSSDQRSGFSNFGSTIDVMAPGEGIYSTLSGGNDVFGALNGTSMACPMVAGLCGLLRSEFPSDTPSEIKQRLQNGCVNIDALNPGFEGQMGAGRINAYNSLSGTNVNSIGENSVNIIVFPNPTKAILNIHSDDKINSYSVLDLKGSIVQTERNIELNTVQVSTFNLENGVYFLLVNENSSKPIKFIVNK